MSYKHILVAVDLSDESVRLIRKSTALAKSFNAELSLIHIIDNYSEAHIGFIDLKLTAVEESKVSIQKLQNIADYPIKYLLVKRGSFRSMLFQTIDEFDCDLLVCGHHHTFIKTFLSSAQKIINHSPVQTLVMQL